jgi:restriction system protein
VLARYPDGIRARSLLSEVETRLGLTDFERANYPGTEVRRFEKTVRFQTINAVKAGWMIKDKGIWSATADGLAADAAYRDPAAFMEDAERLYRAWARGNRPKSIAVEAPDEDSAAVSVTLERAEEMAWDQVRHYLSAMDPYDFQESTTARTARSGLSV